MPLLLSTAYAPPLEYMALLYAREGEVVYIESYEHIVKQSWRNRCDILTSNGLQSLTIPLERPAGGKTLIRDVRLSSHGAWRHLHTQALRSSYGSSPFFEYYWDDIRLLYDRQIHYLWDFNWGLMELLCRQIDLDVALRETTDFIPVGTPDYRDMRYTLHPRYRSRKPLNYSPESYYQPFAQRLGFVPNLSVFDLVMNLGPESLLYLRDLSQKLCL